MPRGRAVGYLHIQPAAVAHQHLPVRRLRVYAKIAGNEPLLQQVFGAKPAGVFLVRHPGHQHAACGGKAHPLQKGRGHNGRAHAALHIHTAAPIKITVRHLAAHGPYSRAARHRREHIQMAVPTKRGPGRRALPLGYNIGPARLFSYTCGAKPCRAKTAAPPPMAASLPVTLGVRTHCWKKGQRLFTVRVYHGRNILHGKHAVRLFLFANGRARFFPFYRTQGGRVCLKSYTARAFCTAGPAPGHAGRFDASQKTGRGRANAT